MPSPDASRQNALKSTGPRTPQGKAVSRFNALWHGGCAKSLLLPDEDENAFSQLQQAFLRRFHPVGPEEQFLVDRMLLAAWRLHRLAAMEARVVTFEASRIGAHDHLLRLIHIWIFRGKEPLPPFLIPTGPPDDPVAVAVVNDSENTRTLGRLSRWQNALERSYYRAFEQLRQLRRSRRRR